MRLAARNRGIGESRLHLSSRRERIEVPGWSQRQGPRRCPYNFAGKKVREEYPEPVPTIDQFELIEDVKTLPLELLVRMKLTSYRRKDQVHILDMISIGLIDESWLDRFSREIGERLKALLDDPDG